jgi:MFS family permease
VAQGLINAFDMPARQAFLVEMVTRREDLPNAIALNSSLVNGGRLIGPSLAGIVIALVGEGWCFAIDAVSYVAVVIALVMMEVTPAEQTPRHTHILHDLAEGFRYTFGHPAIRSIILLLALVSFTGMPYTVFMPVFAGEILHGGPYALGFLTGASGVGALLGALYLARRPTVLGLGRIIVGATALFGGGLIAFAWSPWLELSMLLMVTTGLGMMVQMASSNTILQTIVDEDKRGRVMSFYSMAFLGMVPFGSLFAGALGSWIGVPATVMVGGAATLVGAAAFAAQLPRLRALVRPTYVRLGILPQVATGVQSAAELTRPPAQ